MLAVLPFADVLRCYKDVSRPMTGERRDNACRWNTFSARV